jgi:hypothetical protein
MTNTEILQACKVQERQVFCSCRMPELDCLAARSASEIDPAARSHSLSKVLRNPLLLYPGPMSHGLHVFVDVGGCTRLPNLIVSGDRQGRICQSQLHILQVELLWPSAFATLLCGHLCSHFPQSWSHNVSATTIRPIPEVLVCCVVLGTSSNSTEH